VQLQLQLVIVLRCFDVGCKELAIVQSIVQSCAAVCALLYSAGAPYVEIRTSPCSHPLTGLQPATLLSLLCILQGPAGGAASTGRPGSSSSTS
jgi:hypothetical protein